MSSSSGYFYTIENDNSETTEGLIDQLNKHDKKVKRAEEERRKKEREEPEEEDPAAYYRAAHYFCKRGGPGPIVVIPRWVGPFRNDGAIEAHIQNCEYCAEFYKRQEHEQLAKIDGDQRIHYCIARFNAAIRAITSYQKLVQEIELKIKTGKEKEKITPKDKDKLNKAYDAAISAEDRIWDERIWLNKLLHNEEDEILRQAAQESFKEKFPKETKDFVEHFLQRPFLFPKENLRDEEHEVFRHYRDSLYHWRRLKAMPKI